MKALVKAKADPDIWLEDVPEPGYGIDDVLIKVLKTGICGTDMHIYNWDEWARRQSSCGTVDRPRIRGQDRRGGRERAGPQYGRRGQRRGPHRLRTLPQLPAPAGATSAPTRWAWA